MSVLCFKLGTKVPLPFSVFRSTIRNPYSFAMPVYLIFVRLSLVSASVIQYT